MRSALGQLDDVLGLGSAPTSASPPDDPFFDRDLLSYFPPRMVEQYREQLLKHRLPKVQMMEELKHLHSLKKLQKKKV